jgi:signal transduction histidine kinase
VLAEHDPELGEEMLHEVGYLASLADRLLTLARADSKALHLDSRPVEVVALCRRAAERNEQVLGVRTELTADGELYASADPVALQAALDAVLENVARHGGGRASIACRTQEGKVRIVVTDRGPGLAPEQRTQAFDRFYRVDAARTREHGGAGLGLPLSKALTEAQGGQVWLEESPGGGLTAVFAFPPAVRSAPSPALSADPARLA